MNKKQKRIVIIFLIILALSLFVPPKKDYRYSEYLSGRYYSNDTWHYEPILFGVGHINYTALLIQDIIILIIFSVIYLISKDKK